jgi:hypothetical protein
MQEIIFSLQLFLGINTDSSSSPTCGCCPSPRCATQRVLCSSNIDCECLLMTVTGGGICANAVISCSTLTRCASDNQTCSLPNTVCVNNTRCNVPVCYPIEQAVRQICPPVTSQNIRTTLSSKFEFYYMLILLLHPFKLPTMSPNAVTILILLWNA